MLPCFNCLSWQGRLEYMGIILGNKVIGFRWPCDVNYTIQISSKESCSPAHGSSLHEHQTFVLKVDI
ncbi:hypothetical protein Hanom_Chr16g01429801 [Helianthus anomalus]